MAFFGQPTEWTGLYWAFGGGAAVSLFLWLLAYLFERDEDEDYPMTDSADRVK